MKEIISCLPTEEVAPKWSMKSAGIEILNQLIKVVFWERIYLIVWFWNCKCDICILIWTQILSFYEAEKNYPIPFQKKGYEQYESCKQNSSIMHFFHDRRHHCFTLKSVMRPHLTLTWISQSPVAKVNSLQQTTAMGDKVFFVNWSLRFV